MLCMVIPATFVHDGTIDPLRGNALKGGVSLSHVVIPAVFVTVRVIDPLRWSSCRVRGHSHVRDR